MFRTAPHKACSYTVGNIKQVMIDEHMLFFPLTGMTLEDKKRHNDPFKLWKHHKTDTSEEKTR